MSLLTCPRTVKPRSELFSGLSNLASDGRDAGSNAEGSLGRQAIVGQGRSQFYEWCDDGILPLICPTCQKRGGGRLEYADRRPRGYFAWGCFRYFNRDTATSAFRPGAWDRGGHVLCMIYRCVAGLKALCGEE